MHITHSDNTQGSSPLPATVQAIGDLRLEGNLVPHSWYHHPAFRYGPTGGGKTPAVNLVAITLMADLIYWYRPVIEIDEASGRIKDVRKKFSRDMLQKGFSAWAQAFGFTRRQVRDAVAFLKKAGLVTVEYRDVIGDNGRIYNNSVFIAPVPDAVRDVSRPFIPGALGSPVIPGPASAEESTEEPSEDCPVNRDAAADSYVETSHPRTFERTTLVRSNVRPSYVSTYDPHTLKRDCTEITCTETPTKSTNREKRRPSDARAAQDDPQATLPIPSPEPRDPRAPRAPREPREPRAARATAIGEFLPDKSDVEKMAQESGLSAERIAAITLDFRDYWLGTGKKMVDWTATWRRWVRKEASAPPRGRFIRGAGAANPTPCGGVPYSAGTPRTPKSAPAPAKTLQELTAMFANSKYVDQPNSDMNDLNSDTSGAPDSDTLYAEDSPPDGCLLSYPTSYPTAHRAACEYGGAA